MAAHSHRIFIAETMEERINKRHLDQHVDTCDIEATRQNIEKQRSYTECLKTPEKKTELMQYRQKRAARKRDGEHVDTCDIEAKRRNVEKQRRYIECLKTPEKKIELLQYRQKRAARRRELRSQKRNGKIHDCIESVPTQKYQTLKNTEKRVIASLQSPEESPSLLNNAIAEERSINYDKSSSDQQVKERNAIKNKIHCDEPDLVMEVKNHNVEKQRRYMECLRTPEKKTELFEHKKKRAARQKEMRKEKKDASREHIVTKSRQKGKKLIAHHDLRTFDETCVQTHNVGQMKYSCSECGALMFKDEKSDRSVSDSNPSAKFSLCCSYGKVKLPPIKDPAEKLKCFLTGSTKKDRDFHNKIRGYNSSLAFASMCLTQKEYKFKTNGPYCFRISGQVYHALSQMKPEDGRKPKFSQIYIYDQENELDNRLQSFDNLDREVLRELQEMIKEVNPYAHLYKQAGDIMKENPTEDIKLVLKVHNENTNLDPQRYNLPTGTDIAIIFPVDRQVTSERDIIVYKNAANHPDGKQLMTIKASHPMYDPLMYVLMFPFGDKGWEVNYTSDSKEYTAKQYYQYRLMIHGDNSFNTIHRMGRLFQQYVVDIYAKIEDGHLKFI